MRNAEHAVKLRLVDKDQSVRKQKTDNREQYTVRVREGSVQHHIMEAARDTVPQRSKTATTIRGAFALCCANSQGWIQMVDQTGPINDVHTELLAEAKERYGIGDPAAVLEAALRIALDAVKQDSECRLLQQGEENQEFDAVTTNQGELLQQTSKFVTTTDEGCYNSEFQVPDFVGSDLLQQAAADVAKAIARVHHIPRARAVCLSLVQSVYQTDARMRVEDQRAEAYGYAVEDLERVSTASQKWSTVAALPDVRRRLSAPPPAAAPIIGDMSKARATHIHTSIVAICIT